MTSRSNLTTALPTILIAGKPFVVITTFLPPMGISEGDDPTVDPAYISAARPASPIRVEAVADGLRLADKKSWLSWSACRRIGSSGGIKSLPLEFVDLVNAEGLEVEDCPEVETASMAPEVEVSTQPKKPKTQKIKIALIRLDGGTQLRAGSLNEGAVDDYADAIERGEKLPPVILIFDGADYWLVGGFHRLEAHKQVGKRVIEAEVHQGTLRDAVLLAVSENATHGLRRTNADKRKAVSQLLNDIEWCEWSDRKIAEKCGVSQPFVSKLRKEPQSDNGYHPAEGDESEKTVAPPGDSANYAVPGNCDFGDFDQDDEDIEAEEDSQEDCNVDAVVDAAGAPTPVTEPQERESESSVSPNKAEAGGTEDAVSVDGAVDAAIAEPPQVELVTSDEASESEGEDDVEGEDTEDEEPDQEGEVGKDAPKKPIDPVDAWAVVLATVRQRPDLAPRLIKGLARAGGVYVAIEGAADEASETAIQRLQSQLLRQYARLADEDYEEASSLHERLFRDLQQVFLDRQPQDWGEEGEEDYED